MPAYIGVNGKAKSIAKVYVGNSNSKAELIWGPRGPNRYSKDVDSLSVPRYALSGNEIGDYALFAGGVTDSSSPTEPPIESNAVDAYDKALTRTTATSLSVGRHDMASANNAKHAIFAGGIGRSNVVDSYDISLTRNTPTVLSVGRSSSAACGNEYYAAIAGGVASNGYSKVVDAYNKSLTRSSPNELSEAKSDPVGAVIAGSVIIFAGGYASNKYVSTVEVYYWNLTKGNNATALSEAKAGCVAASVGAYGIIAGGGGMSRSNTVDAYNKSLVKTTPATLTSYSTNMAATVLCDEYALFFGFANSKYYIDAYDYNLTKVFVQFGTTKVSLASASIGEYALLAGGTFNSVSQSSVDAFHIFE